MRADNLPRAAFRQQSVGSAADAAQEGGVFPQHAAERPACVAGEKPQVVVAGEAKVGGRKLERREIAQYPPAWNALSDLCAVQVYDGEIHVAPRERGGVCPDVADVEVAMVDARPVQGTREVGDRADQTPSQCGRRRVGGPCVGDVFQADIVIEGIADDERTRARRIQAAPAERGDAGGLDAARLEISARRVFVSRAHHRRLEVAQFFQDFGPSDGIVHLGEVRGAALDETYRAPILDEAVCLALQTAHNLEWVPAGPGGAHVIPQIEIGHATAPIAR